MADTSKIEWTDSTFNPWIGCTKVSPACDHCYAEAMMDTRMGRARWGAGQPRVRTSAANWRKPVQWNSGRFWQCTTCGLRGDDATFQKANHPLPAYPTPKGHTPVPCYETIEPARRRVFCASLADVLDNEVPPEWRWDLFRLIRATPNLDWLLLTKRIGNAAGMLDQAASSVENDFVGAPTWARAPWPNVWLGATICNQAEADRDIPKLLATPAAVRFVSIEPMLGPIDLTAHLAANDLHRIDGGPRIDWVIAGGESGPNARPSHPDWFRTLRDQCAAAGVPYLFKQWGEWRPISEGAADWHASLYRSNVVAPEDQDQDRVDDICGRRCKVPTAVIHADGSVHDNLEPGAWQQGSGAMLTFKTGKKAAGRLLDGREHNGFPPNLVVHV